MVLALLTSSATAVAIRPLVNRAIRGKTRAAHDKPEKTRFVFLDGVDEPGDD